MKAIVLYGRPVKRDMALIAGMAPGTCICNFFLSLKEEVIKKQWGGDRNSSSSSTNRYDSHSLHYQRAGCWEVKFLKL